MANDYLFFNSDGTFTAGMWDWDLDTLERVENAARAKYIMAVQQESCIKPGR